MTASIVINLMCGAETYARTEAPMEEATKISVKTRWDRDLVSG